jgi:type I restriction enzyme S subunit
MNDTRDFPASWHLQSLGRMNAARPGTINPAKSADELFEYYSIPAYRETQRPNVVRGKEIGSAKLLLESGTVLFGKLNPRVEKVWRVGNYSEHRKISSTEWIPIVPATGVDAEFLYFLLWSEHVMPKAKTLVSGSTPSRQRVDPRSFYRLEAPLPPLPEQRKIAVVLGLVQRAMEQQERLIALTTELKKALLHELFTRGLRGELQKQTKIGPMPESWEPTPLGTCCDIVSGSLSYTDFLKMASVDAGDAIECMGVKVSDMNLPGNENKFVTANAVRHISVATAHRKLVPPNTVVFPKRGAAIATNKKRLTTTWTVLDPNLIGVHVKDSLDADFLFHWVQTFDLRRITDPGPTPQLNKKDLIPVLMPLPKEIDEQRDIANMISTVDRKLILHQGKHAALTALFRTLLHQLMTAQTRVHDLDLSSLPASPE